MKDARLASAPAYDSVCFHWTGVSFPPGRRSTGFTHFQYSGCALSILSRYCPLPVLLTTPVYHFPSICARTNSPGFECGEVVQPAGIPEILRGAGIVHFKCGWISNVSGCFDCDTRDFPSGLNAMSSVCRPPSSFRKRASLLDVPYREIGARSIFARCQITARQMKGECSHMSLHALHLKELPLEMQSRNRQ